MLEYINQEPDINPHEIRVTGPTYITLPSRINHMQAGANRGYFEEFIKGKKLGVVSKSRDGKFLYAMVNGEKHAFHVDDLISDDDYREAKRAEFAAWEAKAISDEDIQRMKDAGAMHLTTRIPLSKAS